MAVATGRKLAVFGRSMEASFRTARELGYIKAPDDTFIDGREINQYPSEKVIILGTGSHRGTNGGTKSYRKWDSPPNLNSTW